MPVRQVARPKRPQRAADCVCGQRIVWTSRGWHHAATGAVGCTGDVPRRRREREAPEIGAFVSRMLRALIARAEAGDIEVLAVLREADREISATATRAAAVLRDRHGYSCAAIGAELGMSRQAVLKRLSAEPAEGPTVADARPQAV